jgi:phage-related protein
LEKKIKADFYRTKAGNEPVLGWLREQDAETRRIIGEDLRTVEIGWPMGMPLVRSLGDGLYEVRITLPAAIARVIFFQSEENMVIVEGFFKKSQRTPTKNLDNAKKRKGDYEKQLDELRKADKAKK